MKRLKFVALLSIVNTCLVEANTNKIDVADLGNIVVEGASISKYRPEAITGATFTDLPSELSPTTVDTLTSDFIREQNPTDLHDLMRFVPGIETGGKSLLVRQPGTFSIRGKGGSEPTIDGVLPIGAGAGLFMDAFLLDRVEVVKGPIASLSGGAGAAQNANGGGGSVNLYLKSAHLRKDEINLQENSSVGKHTQRHRAMADANEVFLDGKAAVRMIGTADYYEPTYINQGLQKGAKAKESFSLAPSFIFKPSEDVSFGLKTLFQYTDQPSYIGVPVFRGRPGGGYSWYESSCRRGDRSHYEGFMVNPWVDWQVTEDWLLKFGASMMVSSWSQTTQEPYTGSGDELNYFFDSGIWYSGKKYMVSNFSDSSSVARNYNTFIRSIYDKEFATNWRNTFLVQSDYYYRESSGGFGTPTSRYGITVQDRLEWKFLAILAGIRYDHFEVDSYTTKPVYRNGNLITPALRYFHQTADAVSPRGGLTITPVDWLVFFGNLSQTRTPMLGYRNADGSQPSAPWRATQYEGGVRVSPADKLWVSLSTYRIEQENTPVLGTDNFYYYEGRNVSRGAELSVTGDITENWSIMAMASFNKYKDRMKAHGTKAREFERCPEYSTSLNTSYRFSSGPLEDIVIGGAYRFKTKSYACMRGEFVNENIRMNPMHLVDINVAIPFTKFGGSDNWTLTLGIRNLFGEKYFESARHYYECLVGEPRTFELGIRAQF